MSLDQNLFTLNIRERQGDARILELVDAKDTVHYRKERLDGSLYSFNVFDPLSQSLLGTVSASAPSSKQKTIELHNPSVPVELKFTGNMFGSFRWSFSWEDHEFEWKREECFLIRKPDPPVLVAITKEPAGKIRTQSVQFMDYNLHRFEIQDRKGLEIVMLCALLSFQDYNESQRSNSRREENSSSGSISSANPPKRTPDLPPPLPSAGVRSASRDPPPRPPKTGVEMIAALQADNGVDNIVVFEEGPVRDYAQYCSNMLQGDVALFIVVKSSSPETVPKVLQVVHQVKTILHAAGEDDELYQYVHYDKDELRTTQGGKKAPRVIKLDSGADKYQPPSSLTVHLSKIPMPELQPRAKAPDTPRVPPPPPQLKEKEDKKKQKERERREKEDLEMARRLAKMDERRSENGRSISPSHRKQHSKPRHTRESRSSEDVSASGSLAKRMSFLPPSWVVSATSSSTESQN